MKKNIMFFMVCVSLFTMMACSKEKPAQGSNDVEKDNFSIAFVTDTGGIDDRSFNQATWEGILRAAKDVNAKTVYAQSNSDADYIPNLSTFAEDDHNIIIASGFLFEKAIVEVAKNFTDKHFLIIDAMITGHDNVASAVFVTEEGSFLAGVAAAEMAKEADQNAVGFIGGGDFAIIHTFEAGFVQGVKAVDPNMEVLVDYIGSFSDAGKGQSLASKMYDNGAYIIFHAAGGAGNGIIKEAKDRRKNGKEIWVIGVDRDQYDDGIYEEGKSVILTSMLKRVDIAAETVSKLEYKGEFPAGVTIKFNASNNGVGIPDVNPNLSDSAIKLVEEYKNKIMTGELTVKGVPARLEKN